MIDLKGKNCKGLHDEAARRGIRIEQVHAADGTRTWTSNDEVAAQALIDTYDQLAWEKKAKREELKAEWLKRLQSRFPDVDSRAEIKLVLALWNSARPAAVIAPAWQFVLDLETAFDNARTTINGYTLVADVQAYNVVTMPAWPA